MPSKKTHQDAAAAKAKKQKIVLGVAGLAFLALCGIQGPKLLKGSSSTSSPPAEEQTAAAPDAAAGAVVATSSPTGSASVVKVTAKRPTTVLAGVRIEGGGVPAAGTAQLVSFSLFEPKDPFVQQTSDETSGVTEPTATPTLSDTEPTTSGDTSSSSTDGSSTTDSAPPSSEPASKPPATTNVTIEMNGKSYPVAVKESFPKVDPLFVVTAAKPKVARIGVAGGSFAGSKTIPLKLSKQVVLVNQTTGARYVLKLVYAGAGPEQTESFTQAGK
jgi:hypothetical protein